MKITVNSDSMPAKYTFQEVQRRGDIYTCKQNPPYIYIFSVLKETFVAIDADNGEITGVTDHSLDRCEFIEFKGTVTLAN